MKTLNEIELFLGLKETKVPDDYYCILTGQFSSGKSKFLNRIFGDEYLPVGTREMTAVPTYIRKGDDTAFLYKNAELVAAPISVIKDIKKGKCDCEKIDLNLSSLNIPENMVFIDTPGVNTISFKKCADDMGKADVILYFLAKSISSFDVEAIDDLRRKSNAGLIIIRTRIDDIKAAEESIYEAYKEEKDLVLSVYPDARYFFVSLINDNCEQNQLYELFGYVKYDLIKDLEKSRKEQIHKYIESTLYPTLIEVQSQMIKNDSVSCSDSLARNTKKQLKAIRKKILSCDEQILDQISIAKRNYYKAGCTFIEKSISNNVMVSCKEIQVFTMKCIRRLESWYKLEYEDIAADICRNDNSKRTHELVSSDVISHIFDKCEEHGGRFMMISLEEQDYDEKMSQYNDAMKAELYLKKLLDSIFIRIEADFSKSYIEQIDSTMKDLENQYVKEDELIQRYITNSDDIVAKINEYLLELDKYGKELETE